MRSAAVIRSALTGCLCLGLALGALPASGAREEHAAALKAAFVLNFLKFAEWPVMPGGSEIPTLEFAVVGAGPIAETLVASLEGKHVRDRQIHVRILRNAGEWKARPQEFDAVFIAPSAQAEWVHLRTQLSQQATLTIGESPEFCSHGGMLNLFEADNRIRFEANPGAAAQAGLKLHAELLKLAVIVPTAGVTP